MLLNLDLQFFGEEDDSLDFDTMLQEFEAEWTEEDETPTDDLDTEVQEETPAEEVEETPEENPQQPDLNDDQKRNSAFADLRRQAQEAKKYQDFVAKLAEQNGIKPDDVLARYEERQLEEQAEAQNVPIDVLKRLQSLEQENLQAKETLFAERFNMQVESTISKYGASDQEIQDTFKYAAENGIDLRNTTMNFEAVHRMAHLDTIVQKEVEKARQTDLETKRKRQASATIPNGNSVTQVQDEWTDESVDAQLAKMGIRI